MVRQKVQIVVDLFNQHGGDLELLKKMALTAWLSGADVVKIQLLDSKKIWGDDSRKYLELNQQQLELFINFCSDHSINWSTSLFDRTHIEMIRKACAYTCHPPAFIKIAASTTAKNQILCKQILEGCSDLPDKKTDDFVVSVNDDYNLNDNDPMPFSYLKTSRRDIRYLYCISKYPTLNTDKQLKLMPKEFCKNEFTGYSDHTLGTSAALLAVARGATIIEKHFTLNANMQQDTQKAHLCSFTPETLRLFRQQADEIRMILD